MKFDTKIKVVLRDDIEMWQKLNVTAFLMSGIAASQDIVGEAYYDKDKVKYLPMSKQPIMIHVSDTDGLKVLLNNAISKEMEVAIFTEELFETYNDIDNREMVANYSTEDLNLVGLAIRGKKNQVDRMLKGYGLHG
jgi:hypothetical protein